MRCDHVTNWCTPSVSKSAVSWSFDWVANNQSKSRKQRNSRSRANIMFAVWFAKKVTSVLWSMVKMHEFREPIKALMQQKIKPKLTRIYLTRQPYKELLMISLLFYLLQVDYVPRPGWGTRATTLRLVGRYITTEYRQCVVHERAPRNTSTSDWLSSTLYSNIWRTYINTSFCLTSDPDESWRMDQ